MEMEVKLYDMDREDRYLEILIHKEKVSICITEDETNMYANLNLHTIKRVFKMIGGIDEET